MEQHHPAPATYRELRLFPDDHTRRELIDGEVIVSAAPSSSHQVVEANLHDVMRQFVRSHQLGLVLPAPLDVILSPTNVAEPDLVFLSQARRKLLERRGINGAPDLCVKVISMGSVQRDRVQKRALSSPPNLRPACRYPRMVLP